MDRNEKTEKFIDTVVNKIPELGEEAMRRCLDNPKYLEEILSKLFHCKEVTSYGFEIWKTVGLGGIASEICRILKTRSYDMESDTERFLCSPAFSVSSEKTRVKLVLVSLAELGFKKVPVEYKDLCMHAKKLGLEPCPIEVGPQLRLQYHDQPKGEKIIVITQPVTAIITEKRKMTVNSFILRKEHSSSTFSGCRDELSLFASNREDLQKGDFYGEYESVTDRSWCFMYCNK